MSCCVFFLSSQKCNAHALRLRGCLNLLCTFPGGHWNRAVPFKQQTSEGARWPLWKRGQNPTTRHRNIASQLHIQLFHISSKIDPVYPIIITLLHHPTFVLVVKNIMLQNKTIELIYTRMMHFVTRCQKFASTYFRRCQK